MMSFTLLNSCFKNKKHYSGLRNNIFEMNMVQVIVLYMMYKNVFIPEDLRTSVFILLPKKKKATECSDYRTISLMCHTLKLLLTVILNRIKSKIDREVGKEQAGFRKNSGTREAIFCLKIPAEKYMDMDKDIFACFID